MDIKRVIIPEWERKGRVIVKYLYYQVIFDNPQVEFDDTAKVLTIEGIKYSYDFFFMLGVDGVSIGTTLDIIQRKDGQITLRRVSNG